MVHTFVCLGAFNINLPAELSIYVVEHLIDDPIDLLQGVSSFLEKPEVLEPERSIFGVVLKTFLANIYCFVNFTLTFFIFGGFKIYRAVRLAVTKKVPKGSSG